MTQEWTGDRLRELRQELGFTQYSLADALGVSRSTVSGWENDRARPRGFDARKLSALEDHARKGIEEALQNLRSFFQANIRTAPNGYVTTMDFNSRYGHWCNEHNIRRARNVYRLMRMLGYQNERHRGVSIYRGLAFDDLALRVDLSAPPPEPRAGIGPSYEPRGGKLALSTHPPREDEIEPQRRLHERLRTKAEQLSATLANAGNQYVELIRAVDDYANVLRSEIEGIDVVSLWSVGGSLHALKDAYEKQAVDRTIAPALEPQMAAALSGLVRDHGAFVLGFEEGRVLVERADKFLLQRDLIAEIQEPGEELLGQLADNEKLVDEPTRRVHADIRDVLRDADWAATRTAFAAYVSIRNAFRVLIKFSVGKDPNLAAMAGAITAGSALVGDPNCEFVRVALQVVVNHGNQLLAFFNHSPEFRSYVEWALHTLEQESSEE